MLEPRIKILPKHVANQIAAGEVVERPASVVKELLENSLDAGATVLEIDIEKGGVRRILIRDDGAGIPQDDLPLAIAAHATSKLTDVSDLENLHTLGFRGEALASIAAVSELSIQSKHQLAETAWQLNAEQKLAVSAHPQGTSIDVRSLFYNTSVRRKFLKSERTEFQRIEEVVKRVILSRYDVAVLLQHNGKRILQVKPCTSEMDYINKVGQLLGKTFATQAIYLDEQRADLRLWGWVSPPSYSRAHADAQYFFLNGRVVRDKLLNHAVRTAYQNLLETGQQAAYVLYLEIEPALVDVNVHPTKHEVRFCEPRLIHDFVQYTLQQELKANTSEASVVQRDSMATAEYAINEPQRAYQAIPVTTQMSLQIRTVAEEQWIVYEQDKALFCLDYRAAFELLLQQQVREQMVVSKRLLLPVSLEHPVNEFELLLLHESLLQQFGFVLRQTGEKSLLILEAPTCIADENLIQLFENFAREKSTPLWLTFLMQFSRQKSLPPQQELTLQVQYLLKVFQSQLAKARHLKRLSKSDWQRLMA
jgi:DNA mismatch repair protein MutL